MTNTVLPYLLQWEMITEAQRPIVGLPVRDGGLASLEVRKTAIPQYKASVESTEVLQSLILDRVGAIDASQHDAHMYRCSKKAALKRQERRAVAKAESIAIENGNAPLSEGSQQLSVDMRRALGRARDCQHRGAGLIYTIVPSKALGLTLDSVVFSDSIAVRYNTPTLHAASEICTADKCHEAGTLEHVLTCPYGSNIIDRHNAPINTIQEIALTVLGDTHNKKGWVKREPIIRTEAEAAALNANLGPGIRRATALKGDLSIKKIVQQGSGILIIDGRCTYPDGQKARTKPVQLLLEEQEREKRGKHQAACSVKHMAFLPVVWTTCGAKGNSFMKLVNMLSERLSEKWNRPKGRCKAWINARLAISIAKATSACIRNVRGSLSDEPGKPNALRYSMGRRLRGG